MINQNTVAIIRLANSNDKLLPALIVIVYNDGHAGGEKHQN